MTEESSAPAPPDNISRLSLVSEFINNEMAEDNLKLADPFTPNFGDAVTGGGGVGGSGQAVFCPAEAPVRLQNWRASKKHSKNS